VGVRLLLDVVQGFLLGLFRNRNPVLDLLLDGQRLLPVGVADEVRQSFAGGDEDADHLQGRVLSPGRGIGQGSPPVLDGEVLDGLVVVAGPVALSLLDLHSRARLVVARHDANPAAADAEAFVQQLRESFQCGHQPHPSLWRIALIRRFEDVRSLSGG
jgi:hypothetical protein